MRLSSNNEFDEHDTFAETWALDENEDTSLSLWHLKAERLFINQKLFEL